ncbi:MAG: hypothetical protein K0S32_1846 [Bacteroidetes bacterium]|jgi:hypothetical protein|nr:hypothetical protein [Bacteroidota bacterium]
METKELVRKAVNVATNGKHDHSEGRVAKEIENQTAKIPSDVFLWTGIGCLGASAILRIFGMNKVGQFVGSLAAPILIMGLYNKVVKTHGSDKYSPMESWN